MLKMRTPQALAAIAALAMTPAATHAQVIYYYGPREPEPMYYFPPSEMYRTPSARARVYRRSSTIKAPSAERRTSVGPSRSKPIDISVARPSATPTDVPARDEVREAQVLLNRLGYSAGEIDGVLGLKTVTALQRFRQDQNISEPALLGAATRQKLAEVGEVAQSTEATATVKRLMTYDPGNETQPAAAQAPTAEPPDDGRLVSANPFHNRIARGAGSSGVTITEAESPPPPATF